MSEIGQLTRGLKFYSLRNADGELPKEVTENDERMEDINFYLNFIKDKNKKNVDKMLLNIRHLTRNGLGASKKCTQAKQILFSDEVKAKEKAKTKKGDN